MPCFRTNLNRTKGERRMEMPDTNPNTPINEIEVTAKSTTS